jgi:hypothetical protein
VTTFVDKFDGQIYVDTEDKPNRAAVAEANAAERDAILKRSGITEPQPLTLAGMCSSKSDSLWSILYDLPASTASDCATDCIDDLIDADGKSDTEIDAACDALGAAISGLHNADIDKVLQDWKRLEETRRKARDGLIDEKDAMVAICFDSLDRHCRKVEAQEPAGEPFKQRAALPGLILARDMRPRLVSGGTLIKGLLDEGAMSVTYAQSNVGKSFFKLDLACHVAMGWPWRGLKIRKTGAVLYLAAEGGHGFVNRVVAWKRHHGLADDADIPLAVLPSPVNLLDPKADRGAVIDLVGEVGREFGQTVVLVVVDTLSRVMAGGNENGPEDMTAFVANIDAIRASHGGVHVSVVHHAGKDIARGSRGHSSLRAATDTEIELARLGDGQDKTFVVQVKKQRDMPGDETFRCTLKSIYLGDDEDGQPVTSAVVEHLDALEPGDLRCVPGKPDLALDKLAEVLAASGRVVSIDGVPDGATVANINDWRQAVIDGGLIDAEGTSKRRMQFLRLKDTLLKRHAIGIHRDWVWLAYPDGED